MQHAAPRPWIAAGVALVGAGAIAATPAVAPLPDLSALQSRAVQLTAGWADVWQTTETNATDIWDHFSAAPFPALQQELSNQIGYVDGLLDGKLSFTDVSTDIQNHISALFGTPADGDTAAVPGALFGPFSPDNPADSIYASLDPGHGGLMSILNMTLPSLLPALGLSATDQPLVEQVLDFASSPLSGILMGEIGTVLSPALQFNADITSIADALTGTTPDLSTAFKDMLDMPANITNALLNGYGPVDLVPVLHDLGITLPSIPLFGLNADLTALPVDFGGLLSGGGSLFDALGMSIDLGAGSSPLVAGEAVGPLASMVELGQSIAEALGWDGTGDILGSLG